MPDTPTPNEIVEKAQQIAAEAVGQARGAAPTIMGSLEDWFAEAESSISKNPLMAVILAAAAGFAMAKMMRLR
jgi:hypothetical protein